MLENFKKINTFGLLFILIFILLIIISNKEKLNLILYKVLNMIIYFIILLKIALDIKI